ncbi:MAG: hypothetical protein OEN20_02735 [Gammaproteobacteria bacterium]|nr:hypothetical protein [Gammaproteobacteria bacterium]
MPFNLDKLERLETQRRDFLVRALGAGFFASGLAGAMLQAAYGAGKVPRELPPGKSIYEIKGRASVDGTQASLDTQVQPNSLLETGRSSRIIFAVGKDAFILRSNSRLQLSGNELVNTLRLAAGAVLSVFGKSEHRIVTTTASVGIRGTGIYVESDPERSYVCTCYGVTDIQAATDANSREQITSLHHDAPRYVTAGGAVGQRIQPAPFINHTDTELMLIEELVGRVPPFAFSGSGYTAPRRDY